MKSRLQAVLSSALITVLTGAYSAPALAGPHLKKISALLKIEEATQDKTAQNPPHLFQGEFSKEDINSCITSVCGPAKDNWGAYDVILSRLHTPSLSAQQAWQKNFVPEVIKNLEAKKQYEIQSAQRLIDALKKNVKMTPGQPIQAFAGFIRVFAPLTAHITEILTLNASYEYEINPEALDKLLAGSSQEIKKASRLLTKQLLLPLYTTALRNMMENPGGLNSPLIERLKIKYPGVPLKQAQARDAAQLLQTGLMIRKTVGGIFSEMMFDSYTEGLLTDAKNGRDLNKLESDNYISAAGSLEMMGPLFDGHELSKALMAVPFDFTKEIQTLKSSGFAEKNLQDAKSIDINEALAQISAVCQTKLSASLDLNASVLRYRRALDLLKNVKAAAKVVALGLSDEQMKAATANALDAVEFALPETNDEHLQRVANALKKESLSIAKNQRLFLTQDPNMDQLLIMMGLVSSTSDLMDTDKNDLAKDSDVKTVCDSLPVDSVSDYTLTSLGKISVSWFTAAYPELGVGIAAHELGHVVSYNLRLQQITGTTSKAFVDSLSCVANRNPFVMQPKDLIFFDNTATSEEDFADHFSSMVMAKLKKDNNFWYSSQNMACGLVNDMGDSYEDSTLAPGEGDSHSSGFLRLLFVAQDRGQMTPQCQKFLSSVSQAGRSLNCH